MHDTRDLRTRLTHWYRFVGPRRVLSGVLVSLLLVVIGAFMFIPSPPPLEASLPTVTWSTPELTTNEPDAAVPATVKVHVAGAVKSPGVYELKSTQRVVDAVRAAGGATPGADLESINLAQTIVDTEQIYVPSRGGRTASPARKPVPRLQPKRTSVVTVPAPATASPGTTIPQKVNINSATAAQLDELPGVGPSTAKQIIAYRQSKGPFSKVEDLLNVPGIGPAKLDAMRQMVTV